MSLYQRIACLILSPGPSVITEGLQQISAMIARWHAMQTQ
jgi:hypothetical protein